MVNVTEFFSRACQWLGRKTRKLPWIDIEGRQVLASGLFDAEYYCRQLRGRPDEAQGLRAPLKHYLVTGGFDGLNPSPRFDSTWYLTAYRDVHAAGFNPLVHYVQNGLSEGRIPAHGASPRKPARRLGANTDLYKKLWGGFHERALAELRRRVTEYRDPISAWHLCGWDYAHGDVERSLHWLQFAIAHTRGGVQRRHLVALSKCYTRLGAYRAIQVLLEELNNIELLGNALPYVQANGLRQSAADAQRMDALNGVFTDAGLIGIARRDPEQGWGLGNLAPAGDVPKCTREMPLVSVVVPAYNAGGGLAIALDSLLAQSWTQLEIIVVDDGSSDSTAQIAQAYAANDSRVRFIANDANQGAYVSRNNGMRAARGEFVTVHDSDDWSHPQKLEQHMQLLLANPNLIAVGSNWVRVSKDMCFIGHWLPAEEFLEPNVSAWVLRRKALAEMGGWDEVNVGADSEFVSRLRHHYGHQAMSVVAPSVPLSFALSSEGSLTRSKASHVKSLLFGMRRLYRESSRWWHQESQWRPVLGTLSEPVPPKSRPFPVPLGIVREGEKEYDCVVAADFSVEGPALDKTLKRLSDACATYDKVCLLHWPDFNGWLDGPIADKVFEFCQERGLHFAHWGLTLHASKVIVTDEKLVRTPPSDTVRLTGLERVENGQGGLCQPQHALLDYFRRGGINA